MRGRSVVTALLLFAASMAVLGWPSTGARNATSRAVVACMGPLLSRARVGGVGTAELRAARASSVRRSGEQVRSDAELTMRVDGMAGELVVAMSVRRDVYLPFVTFVAAVCAAPVAWRRRLFALLLGVPLATLASFGSLLLTIHWLFAHNLPALIASEQRKVLDLLVGMLLMPSSVRYAGPLLLALACVAASAHLTRSAHNFRSSRTRTASSAPPSSTPSESR